MINRVLLAIFWWVAIALCLMLVAVSYWDLILPLGVRP